MRVVGMDIHRVFAEAVALLDGKATRLGRVDMRRDRLEAFARSASTTTTTSWSRPPATPQRWRGCWRRTSGAW
jgi:hypothetical protein